MSKQIKKLSAFYLEICFDSEKVILNLIKFHMYKFIDIKSC